MNKPRVTAGAGAATLGAKSETMIQPQPGLRLEKGIPHASISFGCLHSSRISTKHRQPFLRDKHLQEDLHSFLGGTSKTLECPPLLVGGVEDHVHLLARFGRTITRAEWVKELKRVSNIWLKEEAGLSNFEWQAGYSDFSVSQSNREKVTRYIANQEKHHRKRTFQDEVRALLTKHKVEWDERYIWD